MSKSKIKWYTLDELDQLENIQYYITFGGRGLGKSYAVDKRLLDNFFNNGEEFMILKRYACDMKTKIASTMLEPLYDYVLETYGFKIRYYHSKWYAYKPTEDGKIPPLSECVVMGYSGSLNEVDRLKGSHYPKVTTIVLEEFMSMNCSYLDNEVNLLMNIVSTVSRNRTNLKIYLLGNAISKTNPYTEALGIQIHRMKHGEIIVKEYENGKGQKTRFAVQRTPDVDVFDHEDNKDKVVYNIFGDNSTGSMITTGEFETEDYPLYINGCCFEEVYNDLPLSVQKTIIHKVKWYDNVIPVAIQFLDYFYAIYPVNNGGVMTYGFKEIDYEEFMTDEYRYIITKSRNYYEGKISIRNVGLYTDGRVDNTLNSLVNAIYQENMFFITSDDGTNVINALRLSGLSI